ncbi:cardiolipin synthase [Verrucomicrobiota bacterium]
MDINEVIEALASHWVWPALAWTSQTVAASCVTIHILRSRRESASALLWIFLAWSIPFFGPLLYLGFGVDRVSYKALLKESADEQLREKRNGIEHHAEMRSYWCGLHEARCSEPVNDVERELNRIHNGILPDHPLLDGNTLTPLVDGDEWYPRLFDAIQAADKSINVMSFIFNGDRVSRQVMELLKQKAESGVRVRLMFDRFGSTLGVLRGLFRRYRNVPNFTIVGWTQANPLKRQFQINLRNHRKIVVIDGKRAFFGGLNFADYHWSKTCEVPIRDYHFEVTGPSVLELQYTFMRDWYFMTNENPEILLGKEYFPIEKHTGPACMRLVNGGPNLGGGEVLTDSFFAAISAAKKQVLLVTPYFVPNQDILRALRIAALRGVDVRLLVPKKNNHRYAGWAGRGLYEELLEAGVKIYERKPPFMHAKALVVDDCFSLVGSANIDIRSLQLNYETNMGVYCSDFAVRLKEVVLADFELSEQLMLSEWIKRPRLYRVLENFCLLMKPVL